MDWITPPYKLIENNLHIEINTSTYFLDKLYITFIWYRLNLWLYTRQRQSIYYNDWVLTEPTWKTTITLIESKGHTLIHEPISNLKRGRGIGILFRPNIKIN